MDNTTFEVGDRVKVREDAEDVIDLGFVRSMRKHCGNEYVVIDTNVANNSRWYNLENCVDDDDHYWIFDESWLKLVKPVSVYEITEKDIEGLLCLK